jgi:phosphoribosylformimino-5-aminoimidazole carboxamide ribotide isomerase
MDITPVIDIRNGVAVRAVAGRRAEYRPLVTPLAKTSAPLDVATGLMSLGDFRTLYIADLDAIEGRGDNRAAVREIARRFPKVSLWVDAGFRRADDTRDWLATETVEAVFGSESIESLAVLERLPARAILSLDFRADELLGPEGMLSASALWPRRVIVMTLDRIGAGAGPDFDKLTSVRELAGDRAVIAAGGVRGQEDILGLKTAGAAGALVATALHEGRVTPSSDSC